MNNHAFFRIHPLLLSVIVVAVVLTVLLSAYGITRSVSRAEVMGGVTVNGTQLGGLTEEEATSAVLEVENQHLARRATFAIGGRPVILDPVEAGFDVDEEAVVANAMQVGRVGNAPYQFLWWLSHVFSSTEVPLIGAVDEDAMESVFQSWETEVIAEPVSHGGIVLEAGAPAPVYPRPGVGMDRSTAIDIINGNLVAQDPHNEDLPTLPIIPRLSDADIDEALVEASQLLSDSIEMVYNGNSLVFTPDQLTEAYQAETITEGTPQVVHSFKIDVIDGYLEPVRSQFEAEPVNAEFLIVGDEIQVVPGKRGTRIDEAETSQKLIAAGMTNGRLGQLPLVEDADPAVTTESLEALGIDHLVSSFTTYHSCCESRVVNIQTMADTIDEHIVMPGGQFSINGFVGQRTEEKGYLPAGTIIAGELVDTVGGGVSQFATTMYNAVFWGGYQDVDHKPHSYYFSRYPEGIEATVNWRTPNLVFRNNTNKAIMIDTQHTDTSITVRIFGHNDGRIVKGEQRNGETVIRIVSEGGEDALHVEGTVSDRFAFRNPGPPRYVPNPALEIDQQQETQGAREGWSVNVKRTISRGGDQVVEEQEWLVTYLPRFAVVEVHPCMIPGQEDTCPTTTTSIPDGSTPTAPPAPTTTEG